jgi:hypothetical protein
MLKSLGFALLACLAFGCSSSSSKGGPGPADAAGGDTGSPMTDAAADGAGQPGIHGKTIDYSSKRAEAGAMIAAAGMMATSDAMGDWLLTPAFGQPFSLAFTKSGYIPLTEQEMTISGDFDQGSETLIDTSTAMLFLGTFKSTPDPSLGILNINVIPNGTTCMDAGGATVTVISPGAAGDGGAPVLEYWKGGFPNAGATSVQSGQSPVAVAYNLPVGVNLSISVHHPTCKQTKYPVTQGTVTYTGNVQVIAGTATSYIRAFLE